MAYDMGEYGGIFNAIVNRGRVGEKKSFLDLARLLEARGVSPAAVLTKGAGELREKTAGAETELGARLAAIAGGERFQTAERLGAEKSALQRLQIGEAGAMTRLNKELNAAMERMKWEWETKKAYSESQARAQRHAGYKQMGISMGLGALTGGLFPAAFGLKAGAGAFGAGALLGAPGLAGLAGQKAGYSMGGDAMMNFFKQYLAMSEAGKKSDITPFEFTPASEEGGSYGNV